ncbi:caffeic acid 3-O-methyltransferase 1-like [Castanea sativa]|uniref:caffeic acid 3-O-methyltransferase 1-like n=1 Tax=Castanea sativa TaxID=21020 RepID=UPI003F65389B
MGSLENKVTPTLSENDKACLQAILVSSAQMFSCVLNATIELDLFGIIARAGPAACITTSEIVSQLPTKDSDSDTPSRLDRMLRVLVSNSLLTCSIRTLEDGRVERLYGLTPTSYFFVEKDDGSSLASLAAFSSHRAFWEASLRMKHVILEGGNQFQRAHGMSVFQYMDKDPAFNIMFNKSMTGLSTIALSKILEGYQGFVGLTSLVDVGGGTGKSLSMVISKYPSIKGINFDLPHVIQSAPSYPGIEHVGGDMFQSVPKGDAIIMKNILHDWNDENCKKLLRTCYKALPDKGKLVIIELLMPEATESSLASQYISRLDMSMLLNLEGQERTEKEYEALCKESGFSNFQVVFCAFTLFAVMEFHK